MAARRSRAPARERRTRSTPAAATATSTSREPAAAPDAQEPLTSSPLRHVKSVRIVRVPTPDSVGMFGRGPLALRPLARRYHTSPCSLCASHCCQEKVCVNIVDLARLVLCLGVAPEQLVVLDPEHASTITLPARIGGRLQQMLLRQVPTPGLPRPACHMLARPGGQLRCGVHGLRPGVCRAYPFSFYTDRDRYFFVGLPFLCPISWALSDDDRHAIEREIVAWRDQNDFAERQVRRWNRTRGHEDAAAFFAFAVAQGARKLGLDPRPYLAAQQPAGLLGARLW